MYMPEEHIATEEHADDAELLVEELRHRRVESTGTFAQEGRSSVAPSYTGERTAHLDRVLDEKYHQKITQVKRLIQELEPHYLNFVDKDPAVDLEKQRLLVDKLNRRISEVNDKYGVESLAKKKAKSQAQFKPITKRNDYNKWYIKPEQRFIEKKSGAFDVDTDHYLERILEGREINRRQLNPFDKKHEKEQSNSQENHKAAVNPNIIKKAAKTMEKNDTRVPVFFLPYLKKQEEA